MSENNMLQQAKQQEVGDLKSSFVPPKMPGGSRVVLSETFVKDPKNKDQNITLYKASGNAAALWQRNFKNTSISSAFLSSQSQLTPQVLQQYINQNAYTGGVKVGFNPSGTLFFRYIDRNKFKALAKDRYASQQAFSTYYAIQAFSAYNKLQNALKPLGNYSIYKAIRDARVQNKPSEQRQLASSIRKMLNSGLISSDIAQNQNAFKEKMNSLAQQAGAQLTTELVQQEALNQAGFRNLVKFAGLRNAFRSYSEKAGK